MRASHVQVNYSVKYIHPLLQLLNAYLGSTFRTIEEIFNDSSASSSNAVIGAAVLAAQVAVAVGVTVGTIWNMKSYFEHFTQKTSPNILGVRG